jgi:hypothetical protein
VTKSSRTSLASAVAKGRIVTVSVKSRLVGATIPAAITASQFRS